MDYTLIDLVENEELARRFNNGEIRASIRVRRRGAAKYNTRDHEDLDLEIKSVRMAHRNDVYVKFVDGKSDTYRPNMVLTVWEA